MAVTIVQKSSSLVHANSPLSVSLPSTVTNGNSVIAIWFSDGDYGTAYHATDKRYVTNNQSLGDPTEVVTRINAAGTTGSEWGSILIWENVSGMSGTFTMTTHNNGGATGNQTIGYLMEVSGLVTSNAFDKSANVDTANWFQAGSDTAGPTAALSQNNELAIAAAWGRVNVTTTIGATPVSGFTTDATRDGTGFGDSPALVAHKIVSDGSAQSAVVTTGNASNFYVSNGVILLATFKAVATGKFRRSSPDGALSGIGNPGPFFTNPLN